MCCCAYYAPGPFSQEPPQAETEQQQAKFHFKAHNTSVVLVTIFLCMFIHSFLSIKFLYQALGLSFHLKWNAASKICRISSQTNYSYLNFFLSVLSFIFSSCQRVSYSLKVICIPDGKRRYPNMREYDKRVDGGFEDEPDRV